MIFANIWYLGYVQFCLIIDNKKLLFDLKKSNKKEESFSLRVPRIYVACIIELCNITISIQPSRLQKQFRIYKHRKRFKSCLVLVCNYVQNIIIKIYFSNSVCSFVTHCHLESSRTFPAGIVVIMIFIPFSNGYLQGGFFFCSRTTIQTIFKIFSYFVINENHFLPLINVLVIRLFL